MLTDEQFMSWYRQKPVGPITERDIELATDVQGTQPLLYFLCKGIKAQKIIEIGVADGSTTLPLLKAAKENGGVVWSIDPSPCEDAKRLVSAFGYDDIWKFIQTKSDDFFLTYKDEIHFACIDGDHSWVQVEKDAHNCLSRLAEGGMVIFHDITILSKEITYDSNNLPAKGNYDEECVHGINKALHLALPKYPDIDFLPIIWELRMKNNGQMKISQGYQSAGFAIARKRYSYEGSLNPKLKIVQ